MSNWRKLENNRIQTFAKEVWLWDDKIGIAVKAPVPSRPWTKIDADFTHWKAVKDTDGEMIDGPRPLTAKDEVVSAIIGNAFGVDAEQTSLLHK